MRPDAYGGLNLWRVAVIQVIAELSCILNAMRLLTAVSPMTGEEAVKPMSRKRTCCKAYQKKGRYCKGCPRKGKR